MCKLNAAGVSERMASLYSLSPQELKAQAQLLKKDFIGWLKVNFQVRNDQEQYLLGMDPEWIENAAALSSLAMSNRLSITLSGAEFPPHDHPISSKLVHTDANIKYDYTNGAGPIMTGHVHFTIEYPD